MNCLLYHPMYYLGDFHVHEVDSDILCILMLSISRVPKHFLPYMHTYGMPIDSEGMDRVC